MKKLKQKTGGRMMFCKDCSKTWEKGQVRTFYESLKCQGCRKLICLTCKGRMYELKDSKTGKFTGYKWRCDCMPKNMALLIA